MGIPWMLTKDCCLYSLAPTFFKSCWENSHPHPYTAVVTIASKLGGMCKKNVADIIIIPANQNPLWLHPNKPWLSTTLIQKSILSINILWADSLLIRSIQPYSPLFEQLVAQILNLCQHVLLDPRIYSTATERTNRILPRWHWFLPFVSSNSLDWNCSHDVQWSGTPKHLEGKSLRITYL